MSMLIYPVIQKDRSKVEANQVYIVIPRPARVAYRDLVSNLNKETTKKPCRCNSLFSADVPGKCILHCYFLGLSHFFQNGSSENSPPSSAS